MGKRYKKGNKGKSRKKTSAKKFTEQELQINHLIKQFRKIVLHDNIMDEAIYKKCNRIRLQIKNLLRIQSRHVHKQSRKRRYVYHDQVMTFKSIYVYWKKETLPVWLRLQYDLPGYIIPIVAVYYQGIKRGCIVSYNIF